MPHEGRVGHDGHLTFNFQVIRRADCLDDDIQSHQAGQNEQKGEEPVRILPCQQPVNKNPRKHGIDYAYQRADQRRNEDKYKRNLCSAKPYFASSPAMRNRLYSSYVSIRETWLMNAHASIALSS